MLILFLAILLIGPLQARHRYEEKNIRTALEHGNDYLLKLLITNGADASTWLHTATSLNRIKAMEMLIENGADVEKLSRDSHQDAISSPLHIAAQKGHLQGVKLLCEFSGADIQALNGDGKTALVLAAQNGHLNILKYLISREKLTGNFNTTSREAALFAAASMQLTNSEWIGVIVEGNVVYAKATETNTVDFKMVEYLVEIGVDVNKSNAIYAASEKGNIAMMELLLQNGADVNRSNALHAAAMNGHFKAVVLLVGKWKADVNSYDNFGKSVVAVAVARYNNEDIIRYLISKGANVNVTNNFHTPLLVASSTNHLQYVKILLENGASAKYESNDGDLSLVEAARNSHFDVVKTLVEEGEADVNLKSYRNETALHSVCSKSRYFTFNYGRRDIVRYLIFKGANVNEVNGEGRSPLWLASNFYGGLEVAKILLKNGADMNQADNYGQSPLEVVMQRMDSPFFLTMISDTEQLEQDTTLYRASEEGSIENVINIIGDGANVNGPNGYFKTPLYAATLMGHLEVMKILLEFGADRAKGAYTTNCSPLHAAALRGNLNATYMLLNNDTVALDSQCNDKRTPIYIASQLGHTKIVEYLISKEANINMVAKEKQSPLAIAAKQDRGHIVKILIEAGADVEYVNRTNPIHEAAKEGHLEVIKLLVELGNADVDSRTQKGETALAIATCKGFEEIVEYLLLKGADVNSTDNMGNSPINEASSANIIKILIEHGANVEQVQHRDDQYNWMRPSFRAGHDGLRPIHSAIYDNNYKALEILVLQGKADVNALDNSGDTALITAAYTGNNDQVAFLLDHGTDPNIENNAGYTCLHAAARNHNLDTLKFLLESGKININFQSRKTGNTALHMVSILGSDTYIINYLISSNADVNAINNRGESPLWNADFRAKETLIDRGAIVDQVNVNNWTALHFAVLNEHHEVVQLFMEKGNANVNAKDKNGDTCLHFASGLGYRRMLYELIEYGADVNEVNDNGESPLHLALTYGRLSIAEMLINNGTDIDQVTNYGMRPIDIAAKKGYTEVMEMLVKKQAENEAPRLLQLIFKALFSF